MRKLIGGTSSRVVCTNNLLLPTSVITNQWSRTMIGREFSSNLIECSFKDYQKEFQKQKETQRGGKKSSYDYKSKFNTRKYGEGSSNEDGELIKTKSFKSRGRRAMLDSMIGQHEETKKMI